jgi:FtsP/CotA-like multicopper oxidase with cupredoxin domain
MIWWQGKQMVNALDLGRCNRRAFMAGTATALLFPGAALASPNTLTVQSRVLDVKGKAANVFGVVSSQGKPGIELVYGQGFDVNVTNTLTQETLLHWHGLLPPVTMDGTPMLSGPTLAAGETRRFNFDQLETGTHWMHSHVGLQKQKLLAAPLIVREKGEALFDEQEHVIMLHDFTFREPEEILAQLQGAGGTELSPDHNKTDHSKMDHSKMGHSNKGHASTGMTPTMVHADVAYDAMLANDRTLDDPEIIQAEKGGRFRLRIINGCSATNMWVDLGALEGELIAVDGKGVKSVRGTRFPLAIAQRADIRITLPSGSGTWPVLFQAEAAKLRSGIILRSGDGAVSKISDQGTSGEALTLALEAKLESIISVRPDPSTRVEMVMLTGGTEGYVWGLNGKASMHDVLFTVRQGERIEVIFHNMTGMAHPMHLHGHYFQVVDINGMRIAGAVRDTVLVPPSETMTIRFDADNPGTWALHCHHLYHMNAGMMGAIAYTGAA